MIKKRLCLALALVLAVGSFAGCKAKVNDSDNGQFEVKERGICFTLPQEYVDLGATVEGYNENEKGYKNVGIFYYGDTFNKLMDEVINMDDSERTPEVSDEYTQKMWDVSRCLMEVTLVENDEYEAAMAAGGKAEDFTYYTPAEYLGTNDGYTYLVSIPQLDDGQLTDAEIKDYHTCRDYMETVKKNIKFIPVELETNETALGDAVPEFTTEDLSGKKVTNDIFAKKDLTVVNLWATFCGPCIEEMPELQALSSKYADKVQFVGIVGDVAGSDDTEHLELAQTITKKAGVKFTNLIASDDLEDFLSGVIGYPTTIFVDSQGNIIGDPIVGSDISGTEEIIKSMME